VHAGSLWSRIVAAVGADLPDVTVDYLHVDAATIFLTTDPARFDVVVTDNLFGDIITDLAAAVTGGIGLAASANINPERTTPSMFEPVHGSAPDIAGQGVADPTAAILSAGLLLDHLGHHAAAAALDAAAIADLADRVPGATRRTPVLGGDTTVMITFRRGPGENRAADSRRGVGGPVVSQPVICLIWSSASLNASSGEVPLVSTLVSCVVNACWICVS